MKIRLKFIKQGHVKFVGHLDIIRLFQRAIKVAQIPIAYSKGFSPHSLIYFAMPLSVGVSSSSEYMDIITDEAIEPSKIKQMLNDILVEGIMITDAFLTEEDSASLMSLVHASAYEILLSKDDFPAQTAELIKNRLDEEELMVQKKGKKGIKTIDIKPMILECNIEDTLEAVQLNIKLLTGSSENLSPQLFLKAVLEEDEMKSNGITINRRELYTYFNDNYIALGDHRRI